MIARHRLFRRIAAGPAGGLIWITAPPGAGKSSLAATWLYSAHPEAGQCRRVWYRVDETDEDPGIFFEYLRDAVAGSSDGAVEGLPDLVPEALPGLHVFAEHWFRTLLHREGRAPYRFVFDDLHHLSPDAATLSILAILTGLLQAGDQVLCLSRQDPPEAITSALSGSRLIHITDLRVQLDEFEDFKRDLRHCEDLTQRTFAARLRRAGNWISELVVAPSSHPSMRDLLTRDSPDTDLVLVGDDDAERRGLLATAFLQVGHEAEWRALGGDAALKALNRLAGERSVVTRLLNGALRKHDLFHEHLQRVAASQLTADNLKKARLDAGRLLVARDELLFGARLLVEADAPDQARDLILRHAERLVMSGHNRELVDLIALLPEAYRRDPAVRLWHAHGNLPFHPQDAREEFAQLWRGLDPEADAEIYALSLYGEVRAALADWSVDRRLTKFIAETGNTHTLLKDAPEPVRQMARIGHNLAVLLAEPMRPDALDTQRELEMALPNLPPARALFVGSMLANYLLWWRGDLEAAQARLVTVAPLKDRSDVSPLAILSWYNCAVGLAFRDGDREALNRLMDEAKAFAAIRGINHRLSTIYWIAAQALAADGDRRAAMETLHHYEAIVATGRRTDPAGPYAVRAALALSAGDYDRAASEAQHAQERSLKAGSPQEIGNQSSLLVMALAAKGDEAARRHLAALRNLAEHTHNGIFRLHAEIADTLLAHAQERTRDFVRSWEQMARIATALGFRRISGMNLSHFSRLANDALTAEADARLTRSLIDLWRLQPPGVDLVHDHWPYPVEIDSLGGFSIRINGEPIRNNQGKAQRKPLELLWSLIVAHDRGLSQDFLADHLWPELEGDRAMHSLRTTIYRLRKLIGPEAVVQENDHVYLNPGYVATDLGHLRRALLRMTHSHLPEAEKQAAFEKAMRLYRGPLLPGIALQVVADERERLEETLANKALRYLLALDPSNPATAIGVHRLRTVVPAVNLPASLAHLWSSGAA